MLLLVKGVLVLMIQVMNLSTLTDLLVILMLLVSPGGDIGDIRMMLKISR
jgi:hypothetical protein